MTAEEVIARLQLQPHPEGGWFRETFRDDGPNAGGAQGRGASTAILYLLKRGERSHWHRVRDAAEVWHHYAGGPLRLSLARPEEAAASIVLGPDLGAGQTPQAVVPAGWWQAAEPLGDYALAGCTVAPAFDFAAFEMAPEGWAPPG